MNEERAHDLLAEEAPRYDRLAVKRKGERYRPDRRVLERGAASLSSSELVALALGSGELGSRLVRRHGLRRLAKLPTEELAREDGVSRARLVRWCAVRELGRRIYADSEPEPTRIHGPADAYAQLRELRTHRKEHLVGLYLDVQHGLIRKETISIGGLNTTRAHPREILHPAIEALAVGFILGHNHPSGALEPSEEDWAFTRSVRRACEIVGIELLDHLVIAGEGYTSLRATAGWDEIVLPGFGPRG